MSVERGTKVLFKCSATIKVPSCNSCTIPLSSSSIFKKMLYKQTDSYTTFASEKEVELSYGDKCTPISEAVVV